MAFIELQHVDKHYPLGEIQVEALKSVSLQIDQGECVALTGPSGSGKSTLCHLIGALDRPSAGSVRVDGVDLGTQTDDALSSLRNASIGFIFQSFNLINVFDALENVMLPLQLNGQPNQQIKATATQLLTELGLESQLHQKPDQMSGGQRQRVAIARALVHRPSLIIADEPTANLDTENSERVLERMLHYNKAWGTTFLLSTHDTALLERIPRTIRLRDGQIAEDNASPALC